MKTLWTFLKENKIVIPIIQRDYAQGRKDKKELLSRFLEDLHSALDSKTTMVLDFIYGSKKESVFQPLDGQQRLTTLWLLHWYIASKANILEANKEILIDFSYETRVSSREFCRALCNKIKNTSNELDVVEFIENQTWFFSEWKQDPTINAMLNSLKLIEKYFGDCDYSSNWAKLTEENIIVFEVLELSDFGLSDDLYIKMNARGKPLTSFENFKADFISELKNVKSPEDVAKFTAKIDNDWSDVFWNSEYEKLDDVFFEFINRFFYTELFVGKTNNGKDFLLDIGKGEETSAKENENICYTYLNKPSDIVYENIQVYKYDNNSIPEKLFSDLEIVLDKCSIFLKDKKTIPECSWNEFYFLPIYTFDNKKSCLQVSSISQIQRIVSYAIIKYFLEVDVNNLSDTTKLSRWLRVIWNLVSGEDITGKPQIRSISAMRAAITFIEKLDSQDIYGCLKEIKINDVKPSEFDLRCIEEKQKAIQILSDPLFNINEYKSLNSWEYKIIQAEEYAFFKGSIQFLFHNENGEIDWNSFEKKWFNVQNYFDNDGIKEKFKIEITKSLVIQCDKWDEQLSGKQLFDTSNENWKWILNSSNWQKPIHNILTLDNLSEIKSTKTADKNTDYVLNVIPQLPFNLLILNKYCKVRFQYTYEKILLHRPSSWYDYIILDYDKFNRNSLLTSLAKDNKITIESINKMKGTEDFLFGLDIYFSYNSRKFKYTHKDEIFLLDDNWGDSTLFFYVNDMQEQTPEKFVEKLEECILRK